MKSMTNTNEETGRVDKMLATLEREMMAGYGALALIRSTAACEREALAITTSSEYFVFLYGLGIERLILSIAKLIDRGEDTYGVAKICNNVSTNANKICWRGNKRGITIYSALASKLSKEWLNWLDDQPEIEIRNVRDRWLAHNDRRVWNENNIAGEAFDLRNLERMLDEVAEMCNDFRKLLGSSSVDYKMAYKRTLKASIELYANAEVASRTGLASASCEMALRNSVVKAMLT